MVPPDDSAPTREVNTLRAEWAIRLALTLDAAQRLYRGEPVDVAELDRAQYRQARQRRYVTLTCGADTVAS